MGSIPTNEAEWRAQGAPWHNCTWIQAFKDLAESYGFTVYTIGNDAHLAAVPPEDHTPYSQTPWPGAQPYPAILALDVMPQLGAVNLADLGQQIENDRQVALHGADAIKYINWTEQDGVCVHDSWEPAFAERASSDTGHIHISVRTDLCDLGLYGWDPFARATIARPVTNPVPAPIDSTEAIVGQLPLLAKGATGQAVDNCQALINTHGFTIAEDGDFGPITDAAVRAFQVRHNVANSVVNGQGDGQVGPHTWAALLDV